MPQNQYLKCPFCGNRYIEAKPGKTHCSKCGSEFEIDDRLACIFAGAENIRIPVNGTVCSSCGPVQNSDVRNTAATGSTGLALI